MHDAVDGAGRWNTQIETQGVLSQMLHEFLEEQSSENHQPSTRRDIKLFRVDSNPSDESCSRFGEVHHGRVFHQTKTSACASQAQLHPPVGSRAARSHQRTQRGEYSTREETERS